MSADQRLVVDLASLGHMNCAQVGELLGISEAGVKSLVSRALQRGDRVALESGAAVHRVAPEALG